MVSIYHVKVAKQPKILLDRIWVIFNIVCFLMALYMTVILIGRYRENISATSIAYKKYAQTKDDHYPTLSICFKGDGLYRYNASAVYEAYGINSANYKMMLQGQPTFRYDYDPTRKLYYRTFFPSTSKTNSSFENMLQNSHDILDTIQDAHFEAEKMNQRIFYKKEALAGGMFVEKPPFYVGFQSPNMRCLTREWRNQNGLIRIKDYLYLDMPVLGSTAEVELFIHYPGQLVTSLDSVSFKLDQWQETGIQEHAYQIKVSQSSVWRKRSVKDTPCLNDIDDYDLYFQEAVSEKLGCVPPFWMDRVNLTYIRVECTSLEKLREVNELIVGYKNLFAEVQTPCLSLFRSVTGNILSQWTQRAKQGFLNNWKFREGHYYIEIHYDDKFYEEITQVEDFGVQDFISNLGGFIGIFLGYSMMQIPELLSKF